MMRALWAECKPKPPKWPGLGAQSNWSFKSWKKQVPLEAHCVGRNVSKRSYKIIEIARLFGKKKIYIAKRPGEAKYSAADIEKIKKKLKWYPKVTLDKGIQMLLKIKKSSRKHLNKI